MKELKDPENFLGGYLTFSPKNYENCGYISNRVFEFFLITMMINFDTWPDTRQQFGAIFYTQPTVVFLH
jgi:hypothetical protein